MIELKTWKRWMFWCKVAVVLADGRRSYAACRRRSHLKFVNDRPASQSKARRGAWLGGRF